MAKAREITKDETMTKTKESRLTAQEAKRLFNYDPNTGIITNRTSAKNGKFKVGDEAGCVKGEGYRIIGVKKDKFRAHRLAWLIHYGVWPATELDHINRDKLDNRIENIREVTRGENMFNCQKHNKHGLRGINYKRRINRYVARLQVGDKRLHLGTSKYAYVAYLKYLRGVRKHLGEHSMMLVMKMRDYI